MTEALIQVDNLSRYYQNNRAINQLSFTLNAGEVLGFLGPNGAGKSTTMQIISGNLAPGEGQVRIAGHDLLEAPLEAKQQLGYLPEHPPVYRGASVDEFLRFCAQLHRIPRAQIAAALTKVKQQCGLEQVGKRLIGNLSKGYQQRVGIAQAIIHNPPVVILDEPTVGLDPIQIREIRELIRSLGSDHSVILSTHILSEVQATCDRVQIIRSGELVYNASIETLNQRRGSSLLVALQQPPSLQELIQLEPVSHAEAIDSNRFRVFLTDTGSAAQLAQAALEKGWELFELIPEQQSLEDLFIELTANESTQQQ